MPGGEFNLGLGKITFRPEELSAFRSWIGRRIRFAGPVVIAPWETGMALDIGLHPAAGWEPWLWPLHGRPPQQWLLRRRGGAYRIRHGGTGLDLTAADDGGAPTVRDAGASEKRQRWELVPTSDRVNFLIRNETSGLVLAASGSAAKGDHPQMVTETWEASQLWVIAQLPVGSGGSARA